MSVSDSHPSLVQRQKCPYLTQIQALPTSAVQLYLARQEMGSVSAFLGNSVSWGEAGEEEGACTGASVWLVRNLRCQGS